jgi:hypothetical protein
VRMRAGFTFTLPDLPRPGRIRGLAACRTGADFYVPDICCGLGD